MVAAVRTMLLGLLVAAGLVFGVTSAGAGPDLVPNPSFTDDCSGVPCHWTATFPSTIARDTVNPHSAPASVAVTTTGITSTPGARSDCFPISPSTAYTLSGWYRTTSTDFTAIRLVLDQYSDASCSPAMLVNPVPFVQAPAVATGAWTFLQGPGTTAATAQAAFLAVSGVCSAPCPDGTTANFDDVAVFTGTLAVTVVSFTAHRAGKGVLVRWRTGTEANELGFNVYRQQGARRVRVNRRLLSALGGLGGSSYSYRDRRAPRHRALRYWLQDVAVDGTRTWHGPSRLSGA